MTRLRPLWRRLLALAGGAFFASLPVGAHDGPHPSPAARAGFAADVTTATPPWTHLNFANDPRNFQFAIVTDRTGSPRRGVFEDAIQKLNWLQPEFVISVGDLIKGNARNLAKHEAEWDEFMGFLQPLEAPFFFAAGNHDIQMKWRENRVTPEQMLASWQTRFGPTHYSFVYQDVLFVVLFSNDGAERELSDAQLDYFDQVMRDHPDPRWTIVLLHHPLWIYPHESGFDRVATALGDRPHTVFAGHHHRYVHYDRGDHDYHILSTTGGGSHLRGNAFGEFDHVTWLTMTDHGPVIANLRLDGILPEDVSGPESIATVAALESVTRPDAQLIVDHPDHVTRAALIWRWHNPSNESIRLTGAFRHQHHVHPQPGTFDVVLPPRSISPQLINLHVVQPFSAADQLQLEFRGELTPTATPEPTLHLPWRMVLPLSPEALPTTGIWGINSREFVGQTTVSPLPLPPGATLRYTTDGSPPTRHSPLWPKQLSFTEPTELQGRLFLANGLAGPLDQMHLMPVSAGRGLLAHYFEFEGPYRRPDLLPDFAHLSPRSTRRVDHLDLTALAERTRDFGAVFFGSITLPESGNYGFHLISEDGARLVIDDQVVVDDPIKHPRQESTGFATLSAGRHRIEIQYFQANQGAHLELALTLPSGVRRSVTTQDLSYDAASRPEFTQP